MWQISICWLPHNQPTGHVYYRVDYLRTVQIWLYAETVLTQLWLIELSSRYSKLIKETQKKGIKRETITLWVYRLPDI